MTLKHSFQTAVRGLTTHPSRSALTILGIVIGVTAIMLVVSLGKGAQNLILSQIQRIGAKVIAVVPGRQPKGPADFISLFSDSLKQKDLELLSRKSNVPHAATLMPVVFGGESAVYGSETYRANVFGMTDFFTQVYHVEASEGRSFTDDEVKRYAEVALLGTKVKEELFGNEEAIGQKIRMKGRNFRVIGILSQKGQFAFINFDDAIIVPYTTAQQYIFGIKHFHRIVVEVDEEKNVPATVEDIKVTLRNAHGITDPSKDDFFVQTQAEAMETVGTITNVLTLFLAAIAAISLFVGGIGIMNIMLVAVTERTREIGLRKALGATEKDILVQFLFEAMILTAMGGIMGILFGTALSFTIALVLSKIAGLQWVFTFPVGAALLGIAVSGAVGIAFGLYPARQASKKSPIEALRYE